MTRDPYAEKAMEILIGLAILVVVGAAGVTRWLVMAFDDVWRRKDDAGSTD